MWILSSKAISARNSSALRMTAALLLLVFSNIAFAGDPQLGTSLRYGLYIKDDDEGWSDVGNGQVSGSVGLHWKTDAFRLSGLPFDCDYRIQVERQGWLPWTHSGQFTSGNGLRLEAIQFRFPKGKPADAALVCYVHLQDIGWTKPVNIEDMTVVGTTGQSRRLEAIQICYQRGPAFEDKVRLMRLISALDRVQQGIMTKTLTKDEALVAIHSEVNRDPAGLPASACWDSFVNVGRDATLCGAACSLTPGNAAFLICANLAYSFPKMLVDCTPAGTPDHAGVDDHTARALGIEVAHGRQNSGGNVLDFTSPKDDGMIVTPGGTRDMQEHGNH